MWTNEPTLLYSEMCLKHTPNCTDFDCFWNLSQIHLFCCRKLTCADLKEKELLISCKNQCPKEVSHIKAEILDLMGVWNFVGFTFL